MAFYSVRDGSYGWSILVAELIYWHLLGIWGLMGLGICSMVFASTRFLAMVFSIYPKRHLLFESFLTSSV